MIDRLINVKCTIFLRFCENEPKYRNIRSSKTEWIQLQSWKKKKHRSIISAVCLVFVLFYLVPFE